MSRFTEIDIKPVPVTHVATESVACEAPSLLPPGKRWKMPV